MISLKYAIHVKADLKELKKIFVEMKKSLKLRYRLFLNISYKEEDGNGVFIFKSRLLKNKHQKTLIYSQFTGALNQLEIPHEIIKDGVLK